MKPWNHSLDPGRVIAHPAVLNVTANYTPGTEPTSLCIDGQQIVTYTRTRLTIDRGAWERLSASGIWLQKIQPRGLAATWVAMTKAEMGTIFESVFNTQSWRTVKSYNFRVFPPALRAFVVNQSTTPSPVPEAPQAVRARSALSCPPSASSDAIRDLPTTLTMGEWAVEVARIAGSLPESAEYLSRVQAWRQLFRPATGNIRVLAIAESAVAEAPGDLDIEVNRGLIGCPGWPSGYVRLVYCPAYGESTLCSKTPRPHGRTPFWHLFFEIAEAVRGPLPQQGRIARKIAALETAKEAGFYLVDASIVGVYVPGGTRRFSGSVYRTILRESYHRFVVPELDAEPIRQVWVIGKSTAEALTGLPLIREAGTIPLPGWQPSRFYASVKLMASRL
jgi:hypothetical protein